MSKTIDYTSLATAAARLVVRNWQQKDQTTTSRSNILESLQGISLVKLPIAQNLLHELFGRSVIGKKKDYTGLASAAAQLVVRNWQQKDQTTTSRSNILESLQGISLVKLPIAQNLLHELFGRSVIGKK